MKMPAGVHGEEGTTATNSSADARARLPRARCGVFGRVDGFLKLHKVKINDIDHQQDYS